MGNEETKGCFISTARGMLLRAVDKAVLLGENHYKLLLFRLMEHAGAVPTLVTVEEDVEILC